ncbi:MAG: endonuclease/exonuclease/phosphatase [Chitinophagaceae bacterium]|nr:endonuclease/exonuclease/phosphatase [Chitinophagaceae bacterium]
MKKYILPAIILFLTSEENIKAQSSTNTLDVVCWNLEFFGSPTAGPANDDLQEHNVKKILRWLDADLIGVTEVVDTMRFRRVVDSLGNAEFAYVIAPYCSGNTTGTGAGWLNCQKQAFIYRKSVFTNVSVRGMMRNSATAYQNWASGRFPFLFSATATIGGVSRQVNFILLHAKAGSTQDDYLRRAAGCIELKDTLDAYYSAANLFIIGDFNDALHTSIYPGASVSPYFYLVSDSSDADHYKSITLPLGLAGQTTMINFPNVIDNHVVSNEVTPLYIPGSVKIRTDVVSIVPDYVTAHNTSDHYPVFSQYNLSGVVTSSPPITSVTEQFKISPNPFRDAIAIQALRDVVRLQLSLYASDGRLIQQRFIPALRRGEVIRWTISEPGNGIYYLIADSFTRKWFIKLLR